MGTEGQPLGWFPSASRQISPEPIMLMGFWGGGGPKMWLKGLRMQRDLDRARGPLCPLIAPCLSERGLCLSLAPPACTAICSDTAGSLVGPCLPRQQAGGGGFWHPSSSAEPRLPWWGWRQDSTLVSGGLFRRTGVKRKRSSEGPPPEETGPGLSSVFVAGTWLYAEQRLCHLGWV